MTIYDYFVTVTKYYNYSKTCQSMNGKNKYLATEDDFYNLYY